MNTVTVNTVTVNTVTVNTVTVNTRRIVLSLFASSLLACGGAPTPLDASAEDASSGGDAGEAPPEIAGHWVGACTPSPQADGSTQYFQLDFDITTARWDLDYVVHADAACSVPLATVHIEGPYEIERPSSVADGAREATFGFDAKTITPHADPITGFLSSQEGCGAEEWQTGVAQDVLETGCAAFGQYPRSRCEADHDLVARDGSTLRFGARPADNDMCTPDRRPTELSPLALELR